MKVFNYIIISLIFVAGFCSQTHAQKVVTGQVVAFNKYPLNKVKIESKKSKQIAYTDTLGYYNIETKDKDRLLFNVKGFQSFTTKVDKIDTLDINLIYVDDKKNYERVIENGTMTVENLDEAIDRHLDENNNFHTFNSIFDVIMSINSSVTIDESDSPVLVYLPQKTFNAGNTPVAALYVVDGMISYDIGDINPFQLKKIKVISGNEATMQFGNRASNGVIVIETKH